MPNTPDSEFSTPACCPAPERSSETVSKCLPSNSRPISNEMQHARGRSVTQLCWELILNLATQVRILGTPS
jgi:hypothetical protein